MLDDLALFVAIVESGSLSAAAKADGTPAATVTRRLQKLERRLGCRLLSRSARRLLPTPEGLQYYEQCRPLVHALQQATTSLDATFHAVAGNIRVLAPEGLAGGPLADAWAQFLVGHPDVTLELVLSNTLQDLVSSGADLAIRIGPQPDSALTQRRIGQVRVILVAAPSYLQAHGQPREHASLTAHHFIVAPPLDPGRMLSLGAAGAPTPQELVRARVSDMKLAVTLAQTGIGLLLCPAHQCAAELERGSLIELSFASLPSRPVYAIWPQQQYLPARVRALVEHLDAFAAGHPLLRGE